MEPEQISDQIRNYRVTFRVLWKG